MSHLKTCSGCGNQVDAQTQFCPQCGSSEFISAGHDPEKRQSDAPKKKGLQWWPILQMVIGVLIVALLVVLIVVTVKGNKKDSSVDAKDDKAVVADADEDKDDEDKKTDEDKDEDTPDETTTKREETTTREEPTKSNVAYTKGEVIDNVYINEWADLQLVIPDGYSDTTSSAWYWETDNEEYGLVLEADEEPISLELIFEQVPVSFGYDEEAYLKALVETFTQADEKGGLEISTKIIAGNTYTKLLIVDTKYETGTIYLRAYDGHLIWITAGGDSKIDCDVLVNMFTPVG